MYLGPLEIIIYNTGTQFISLEFVRNTKAIGSVTKCVLVKAHYLISIVKRYYRPLWRAYKIITKELL
jgi:hypothetical protein